MANRRGFLQAISALAISPALPAIPAPLTQKWEPVENRYALGTGDFTIETWYHPLTGSIDEYRITKGFARYSESGSRIDGDRLHVFQVRRFPG